MCGRFTLIGGCPLFESIYEKRDWLMDIFLEEKTKIFENIESNQIMLESNQNRVRHN